MALRIRRAPDPLSDQSAALGEEGRVYTAQSSASRILKQELRRYCDGHIQGRSFLISGHRGAGKTTMVADVLSSVVKLSLGGEVGLRPLPVMLHGPSLFRALPSDVRRAEAKQAKAQAPAAPVATPAPAAAAPAPGRQAATPAVAAAPAAPAPPALDQDSKVELQAQLALKQIILGLHRAVLREYASAYRRALLSDAGLGQAIPLEERGELAAQFELELMEDPPASRLRELWDRIGALERGVLQPVRAPVDQGSRELVALNGICNAHQRISGELSGETKQSSETGRNTEQSSGLDAKFADALKPAAALLSGAAVAGGTLASGPGHGASALALGLLTAMASSLAFKRTTSNTGKRQRHVDKTFIPDLSLRTLDRVLPTLLERLRAAGLAPVFVIDELDKVDGLSERIMAMVHYLKKLVAESVFTCFLTDRGYMEFLRLAAREKAYGVASSYFSHPLLIAYEPADLDAYLELVLELPPVVPGSNVSNADAADKEILKWVLRHRSQMHALNLTRELAALRTEAGDLNLLPGTVRDTVFYRIDVTLQVVIEYFLNMPRVVGWSLQRPDMRQTLLDALYFITREWLLGKTELDLRDAQRDEFRSALYQRMNLGEVFVCEEDPDGEPGRATGVPVDAEDKLVSKDDLVLLFGTVNEMAALLAGSELVQQVEQRWPLNPHERVGAPRTPKPEQAVREVLLQGGLSFLEPREGMAGVYDFRYWQSGETRAPVVAAASPAPLDPKASHEQAKTALDLVTTLEIDLASVLAGSPHLPSPTHADLQLLIDEALVLPQSPPWQQAMESHQALLMARDGTGNVAELARHLVRLEAFAQMLRDSAPALAPALQMAGFLAGLVPGPQPDPRAAMAQALRLLAQGLGFARLKPEQVRSVLEGLRVQIEPLLAEPLAAAPEFRWSNDGRLRPLTDALQRVAQVRSQGARLRISHDWALREAPAWKQLLARLDAQDRRQPEVAAGPDEILCAMRGVGPERLLPGMAGLATLAHWSHLLALLLSPGEEGPGALLLLDPALRFPLLRSVLLRLGLGRAEPQWLGGFCEGVQRLTQASDEARHQLQRELQEFGALYPTSSAPSGCLVVLPKARGSVTAAWTDAPTRALCLVLAPEDLGVRHRRAPQHKAVTPELAKPPHWLSLLPPPLHLVWEDEAEPPPRQLYQFAQDTGQTVLPLDKLLPPSARSQALYGARGADELVALLRDRGSGMA